MTRRLYDSESSEVGVRFQFERWLGMFLTQWHLAISKIKFEIVGVVKMLVWWKNSIRN